MFTILYFLSHLWSYSILCFYYFPTVFSITFYFVFFFFWFTVDRQRVADVYVFIVRIHYFANVFLFLSLPLGLYLSGSLFVGVCFWTLVPIVQKFTWSL